MKYIIKCDECKKVIGETIYLMESARGGLCEKCIIEKERKRINDLENSFQDAILFLINFEINLKLNRCPSIRVKMVCDLIKEVEEWHKNLSEQTKFFIDLGRGNIIEFNR